MSGKVDEYHLSNTKISGYLEKKGKKKMIASYKKYWFVLEGRLLLYYRSEDEYKGISPCKGSINLGPPCSVKPCLSLPGVFQIETRSSTITLRAENMEKQNKWMHCLMAAINPTEQPPRLSHFRYSLDERQKDIKSQNPKDGVTVGIKQSKVIIDRLQKIGAQSYVTQLLNRKIEVGKKAMSEESLFRGNCDCIVQLSRSSENVGISQRSAEHIYERISKESLGSTGSSNNGNGVARNTFASYRNNSFKDDDGADKVNDMANTRRISEESLRSSVRSNNVIEMNNQAGPTTIIKENYLRVRESPNQSKSSNSRQDIAIKSSTKLQNRLKSLTLGNGSCIRKDKFIINESNKSEVATQTEVLAHENYSVVGKKVDRGNDNMLSENIEKVDHNENKVLVSDNRNIEENAYCIADIYELAKNNDVLYEDLEKYARYCELKNKEVEKNKVTDKKSKKKEEDLERKDKLKKRPSFIKRVWKRKTRKNKDEQILNSSVIDTGDKICISDQTTVKMLSELHDILETKVPILRGKISQSSSSEFNPKSEINSEDRSSNCSSAIMVDICENDTDCPALPPKTKKIECLSPYHDVPTNNKPTVLPAKRKKALDNVKSLDEILDELECERRDETGKVKHLIQQFSSKEFTIEEDGVVLRGHRRFNYPREHLESDELTRLLDELAKVTNAPILTPGATCSLVAPNLKDKELSKLVSERRRRYSEPDYDIPRSHKSLRSFKKKENSDNVIGSTRFFGPILKPSDVISNFQNTSENEPESMTPDSLEENIHDIDYMRSKSKPGHNEYLYNPNVEHRKTNANMYSTNEELIIYNDLYGNFKPYGSIYPNEHYFRNGRMPCKKNEDFKCDDVFIDSLEICNAETSTAF